MASVDSRSLGLLSNKYIDSGLVTPLLVESQLLRNNLVSDQDILESVQRDYFNADESFDPSRFELHKVHELKNSKDIVVQYKKLLQQYQVLSKKVLFLILQKQCACKEEFEKIITIQSFLNDTVATCKLSRDDLNSATHQITLSSFQILYFFRKRKILESILNSLCNIRTLYRTKDKLHQYLNQENYPKAISLISECQKAAKTYEQFNSVIGLSHDLRDTLEQVEENLDSSLSKVCINFNVNNYTSIQVAYYFLGKSETAVDQLHMHFTAAIHSVAFDSVLKYGTKDTEKQYNILCKSVLLADFFPCLVDLCRSLLIIMKSYYLILTWHKNYNNRLVEINEHKCEFSNQQYALQKLENGIIKIHNDIEHKLVIYVDEFDLVPLKFEEFIQVLKTIDRISKIGNKMCKRDMTKLRKCIEIKFVKYFRSYHFSRLDELRIFLEHDGWDLCPIKSTFKISQLQEFKTFDLSVSSVSQVNKNTAESLSEVENSGNIDWTQDYIDGLMSPFDTFLDESGEEDILRTLEDNQLEYISDDSEDDEIPAELKYNHVDDINKETIYYKNRRHTGPIITNTCLSLLRICGKYLHITQLLEGSTKIVLQCMIQMFELYFYTVYTFFTTDSISNNPSLHANNLKRTISRIKDTLIMDNGNEMKEVNYKIRPPHLSPVINLCDPNKLFGLKERIVATESLIFLGHQYESFRSHFNSLSSHEIEQTIFSQSYQQTISLTTALRKPVYMDAVSRAFDLSNILISMNKIDWELREVLSQHNAYVDYLIEEMQVFKSKLTEIQNSVPLSKDVYESIWECVAHLISLTLVEGFSNVKKCSNGGRALMQLDFTQLMSKFQMITSLRPMPYQEYVTTYIKAFYLPESVMESWLKTHSEYTSKQLMGLISCMYQNKKVKQKFLSLISDLS